MRIRPVILPFLAGTMLVGLAACGSGTSASGATTTTSVTTTASSPATSTANQVAAAPGTSAPNAAAAPFTVDLTIQQDGLGLLAVENNSSATTTVNGWPTLTFLNAANETLSVPMQQVKIPGAATPVTLAPGENAFAGVKWTDGDKASASTFVATTLKVTVPGSTSPVVANVIGTNGKKQSYYEFDLASVQVGTLQPTTQGVLVF